MIALPNLRTLLACCALLVPALSPGQEQGPARAQLDTFSAGLDGLHAQFAQRVIGSDGSIQDSTEGEVWLSRPARFRWAYGGDFPELVVADGRRVWIYDEALEQVTVKDQAEAAAAAPLTLLTEPGRLDQEFEVREAGEASGLQLLELRSRNAEAEFERILLGFEGGMPRLMILEDAFGLRTELRFDQLRRNPPLDEALFRFEPPPGVDVIGAVPDITPLGERGR
jgi:outer membrane lipoprotein carrier protein